MGFADTAPHFLLMAVPQQARPGDRFLQRPLYIFDLPEELLYTLQFKPQTVPAAATSDSESPPTATSRSPPADGEVSEGDGPQAATSCNLCGLSFADLQEQRSHVRSDLHGYNMKQKMRGRKAVGEAEFERLVGQLDESLSGSDSSDSEDDD